jgi:hypothetical protein
MLEVDKGGAGTRMIALLATSSIFSTKIPYNRAKCLEQTGLLRTTIANDFPLIIHDLELESVV